MIPGQVSDFRSTNGSHLPSALAQGWLCFDSGTEKRRLAPVPADWAERSPADLWFLCRAAEPVRPRGADCAPVAADPASGDGAGREKAAAV